MPSARFEPAVPLQTYALDRTATEIGPCNILSVITSEVR
jgi:hypothetical protein